MLRGVTGEWAGWAIAVFGRIEGAAKQRRRAVILIAHPVLDSYLRLCILEKQLCYFQETFDFVLVSYSF